MVAGPPLRVVFFGTPQFAVPTLDALLESRHDVVAVVTQPDRPRGRGRKPSDAPVKARAIRAGVPIFQPDRLADPAFVATLSALHSDLGVVAAYGKILPQSVIQTPRLGTINVHASLLPRYRGAAPIHRAVIAGDTETGVTIMRVIRALDAGPMLATVRRKIDPDETSAAVERDLSHTGASLLVAVADRMASGTIDETPQDDTAATYAPRLTRSDGLIDWRKPAVDIHNLIRGLHPWPHAFSFLDGARYILLRSAVVELSLAGADGLMAVAAGSEARQAGAIIEAQGDRLVVAAGPTSGEPRATRDEQRATSQTHVRILEIQPEGKRPLTAREFLAGHHVPARAAFSAGP